MDIGALICTPKNPKCSGCPLRSGCKGKNTPLLYPTKKIKSKVPIRERYIAIHEDKNKFALAHDMRGKMLAGLYGFPQMENRPKGKHIGAITHSYSHFTLKANVILTNAAAQKDGYYTLKEIAKLPLSILDKKVLKILIDHKDLNRQNRQN